MFNGHALLTIQLQRVKKKKKCIKLFYIANYFISSSDFWLLYKLFLYASLHA